MRYSLKGQTGMPILPIHSFVTSNSEGLTA
jgi:hypothetical protein